MVHEGKSSPFSESQVPQYKVRDLAEMISKAPPAMAEQGTGDRLPAQRLASRAGLGEPRLPPGGKWAWGGEGTSEGSRAPRVQNQSSSCQSSPQLGPADRVLLVKGILLRSCTS